MFDLGDDPFLKDRDRRHKRRRAARVRAWADAGGMAPVVDCLVIDVSDGGASVVAVGGGDLPNAFQLHLDTKQSFGQAEVMWRNGAAAGVTLAKPETKS